MKDSNLQKNNYTATEKDLCKAIFSVEEELKSFQYAEDFIHLFNIRDYLDMIKSLHYSNHMSISIFHFLYNYIGSIIMFTIQKEDMENYTYNIKDSLISLQDALKSNYYNYM
jgi:hypothetical protein